MTQGYNNSEAAQSMMYFTQGTLYQSNNLYATILNLASSLNLQILFHKPYRFNSNLSAYRLTGGGGVGGMR